jgi:glycosyltransferase involved in cell wall biosynthesis
MKIAQIAPLMESVPPKLYGGTERVVSYLCEELVRQGHEVTLFASGDSVTKAELVSCSTHVAIRLNPRVRDYIPHYMIMLDEVRRRASTFDVIHFHIDAFQLPLFGTALPGLPRDAFRLDLRCAARPYSGREFRQHRLSRPAD